MKKIELTILWILLCGFVSAQNFTGILTMETENIEIGEKATAKIYIQPPYCKMEINATTSAGTNSYTLLCNQENSDITMISGGTKTTVSSGSAGKSKYLENILIATPTNTKQNLLGYDCTLIKMKSTNASIECIVANNLTVNLPATLQSGILQSLKENGISGTPLEIIVKDLSGKTVITQKVTSIVKQELNDAIFSN